MQQFVFAPLLNDLNTPQFTDPLSMLCMRDEAYFLPVANETAAQILLDQFLEAIPDLESRPPAPAGQPISEEPPKILSFRLGGSRLLW